METKHTFVREAAAVKIHTLETELQLEQPIAAAFAFFSDVNNLQRITPPWLHTTVTPGCAESSRTRFSVASGSLA